MANFQPSMRNMWRSIKAHTQVAALGSYVILQKFDNKIGSLWGYRGKKWNAPSDNDITEPRSQDHWHPPTRSAGFMESTLKRLQAYSHCGQNIMFSVGVAHGETSASGSGRARNQVQPTIRGKKSRRARFCWPATSVCSTSSFVCLFLVVLVDTQAITADICQLKCGFRLLGANKIIQNTQMNTKLCLFTRELRFY